VLHGLGERGGSEREVWPGVDGRWLPLFIENNDLARFPRKKYCDQATLADLRVVLGYVPERGYDPYRLGQDLGISARGVRYWNRNGVPGYIAALAVALTKLTPEQLRDWREEMKFLRSMRHAPD